jgi:hypothetical protein
MFSAAMLALLALGSSAIDPPTQLLVEYLPSPLVGIGTATPRFSWAVTGPRGVSTAAYQIVVREVLSSAIVWDTGKVAGPAWDNTTSTVDYAGKIALFPDTGYEWQVKWWPSGGATPSDFSTAATFHVGLLTMSDWQGAVSLQAVSAPVPTPLPTPAPAPPTVCSANCKMIAVPNNRYYTGSYNESQTHDVKSIPDCQAACLADAACVQITWAPTHPDKCVMYKKITTALIGGAQGWTKCNSSGTVAATCAPLTPAPAPAPKAGVAAEMVRQIFTAPTTVAKSVLYISAVGWTTAQINGVGVAPTEILNPGRTSFDVRQYYMAYDVTDMIKPGEKNCLGLLSAAGWQSMPHHTLSAKALLSITTTTTTTTNNNNDNNNNTTTTTSAKSYVATAANWTGSVDGAITSANIYAGETYDANKEVHLPPPFSAPFCPPPPCSRPNILRPPLCSAHSSHVNHFSLP